MGCANCSTTKNGVPQGCGDKGSCSSGSCNKMNTYDWITTSEISDPTPYNIVEVAFKKGARKSFFFKPAHSSAITGDMVVVESTSGYDVGRITLSGELVRLQMKKKRFDEDRIIHSIIRIANHRDLEKLEEARVLEYKAMVRARVLSRTLGLEMKIGDVEYQGDKRKATFYYTAEGRVDFRELVRVFAKEYRVKIEMRQIGSRQESGRIGGVGACGRELCCSTWLSDFQSVNTSAARYQNISINQTKLSGQCGRLKCCLNFELDMYVEALGQYPKNVDTLQTKQGRAYLMKIDIFKAVMVYSVKNEIGRHNVIALSKEDVSKIKEMNQKGETNIDIIEMAAPKEEIKKEKDDIQFADVTGQIELPAVKRKSKSRSGRNNRNNRNNKNYKRTNKDSKGNQNRSSNNAKKEGQADTQKKNPNQKSQGGKPKSSSNNRNNKPRPNTRNNKNNSKNRNNKPEQGGPKSDKK